MPARVVLRIALQSNPCLEPCLVPLVTPIIHIQTGGNIEIQAANVGRTVLMEGRGDGTLSGWWTGRNLSWSYGRAAERLSFATLLTTYATRIGDLFIS